MTNARINSAATVTGAPPDVSPSGTSEKPPADIVQMFVDTNTRAIDAEGISMPHAIGKGSDGRFTMMALALGPQDAYRVLFRYTAEQFPTEIIFGFDRFSKPDQGTEFGDLLSVHYFRRGKGWRFGVMVYQVEPRIVREIVWEHPVWGPMLQKETQGNFARLYKESGISQGGF